MSEANSYAGTIGAWVGGFVVLFTQSFIAYTAFRKGWSHLAPPPNDETNELLKSLIEEVCASKEAAQAIRNTLENIEKIAVEVQNDAGGMLVIQRMPRSSTQNQDAAQSQQV
ncbi:MAG: hypothetical protein M1830_009908 [Pleopsidium flavum]|nr:MAG: hypothetical protein M1830_009908 [Pleopsidium flavum]